MNIQRIREMLLNDMLKTIEIVSSTENIQGKFFQKLFREILKIHLRFIKFVRKFKKLL